MHIKIFMKDGSVKEFRHKGRSGGSYTNKITYEGAFLIHRDEWDSTEAFPVNDIQKVETRQDY